MSAPFTAPDDDSAEAATLRRYVGTAPAVLKALPESDAPPLSAREIATVVHCAAGTARAILIAAVRLNLARAEPVPIPQGFQYVYTRAPALSPDSIEDSPAVYASEPEAEVLEP